MATQQLGLAHLHAIIACQLYENRFYPVVIGITGNIASGKSTLARQVAKWCAETYPLLHVAVVSTDSFLQSNVWLNANQLMSKKGFPETYDQARLLTFADQICHQSRLTLPVYSHRANGIVAGVQDLIAMPNILIIEGLMSLHVPLRSLLDVGFFIDTDAVDNYRWFVRRCETLELNQRFYHLSKPAYQQLVAKTWRETNWRNFTENVLPTRSSADYCIRLASDHQIKAVTAQTKESEHDRVHSDVLFDHYRGQRVQPNA